ncbi:hypothetical protein RRG08_025825 [Elysia crispata]|uniref:Uncharacterized protein n=1 Tax=Elysia crispata TaxID=231223 RepID=A0AAE0Y389_9GAST|nr:hypothetical protein RRG08_025825 [Elysia crispata]
MKNNHNNNRSIIHNKTYAGWDANPDLTCAGSNKIRRCVVISSLRLTPVNGLWFNPVDLHSDSSSSEKPLIIQETGDGINMALYQRAESSRGPDRAVRFIDIEAVHSIWRPSRLSVLLI